MSSSARLQHTSRHYLTESQVFCMLPWVHLNIQADGLVFPCCGTPVVMPAGNLRRSRLTRIWNSPGMRCLRLRMLAGQETSCVGCHEMERIGHPSMRRWANSEFGRHFAAVESTQADGTVPQFRLRSLDIRFSNACNFRCRTCCYPNSSGWHKDSRALGLAAGPNRILTPTRRRQELWRQLEPLLPGVETVSFVGGEPLIMKEHYRMLDYLIRKRLFQVRLIYNTNFSVLRVEHWDVLRLWRRFDQVEVRASLDAIGARGEYLRKGQVWRRVLANRERMARTCPRARFIVQATLSLMNALHLPDLHAELVRQKYCGVEDFCINILRFPIEYRVQVLPAALKAKIARRYARHIEWLSSFGRRALPAISGFRAAVRFMRDRDLPEHLEGFRRITGKVDRLRGETFAETFPELAELTR